MTTAPRPLTEPDFATLLAPLLEQPVHSVDIVKHAVRLYSSIWILEAKSPSGPVGIVAKYWEDATAFQRQMRALQIARSVCSGRKDVDIPYVGCCEQQHLLLMRQVHDPTVDQLCRLSFSWPPSANYMRHWKRTLYQACGEVGRWLRDWHAATTAVSPVAPLFEAYLASRPECLKLITGDERRKLWTLIQSLEPEVTCVVHGDFTPPNLLWAPGKLTVIDFGLAEWERMTPWWDYVAMRIGLASALRFSMRSPGRWLPSISRMAAQAFSDGYGDSGAGSRARLACLAVRHLVLHANDLCNGRAYRKRAQWHKMELQKALSEASRESR